MLSLRHTKQTSKNVVDTTFKEEEDNALTVENESTVCPTNLEIDSKSLSKFLKPAHSILAKKNNKLMQVAEKINTFVKETKERKNH